ncbi:MAG TPA: BrnT family toxin [Bordetella sp.]
MDFEDAVLAFEGATLQIEDTRRDYGEKRILCYGMLAGRMIVVGYVARGDSLHIFSMRKTNDREKNRLGPLLAI